MALTRYRVGSTVTIAAPTSTSDHAGGKQTPPATWGGFNAETYRRGVVVVADPVAGNGGASLLYSALTGAGANLVAAVSEHETDHSSVSN